MATEPALSPADTRSRLVATAMDLFYQAGYAAVGVAGICARAGVSKSSFYHFFASKEDLALAVIEQRWQGFMQMLAPVQQSHLPALQKVQAVFDGMHGIACATHDAHGAVYGCPFGSLGSELSTSATKVRERVAEVFDRMAALFRDWLAQARAESALDADFDVDAAARDLVAVVQGMGVVGRVYNSPERMRETGAHLVRLILAPGHLAPPHPPTRPARLSARGPDSRA